VNPNLLFLVGAVVLAVLGSVLVRLVTRPRTRPIGANEIQQPSAICPATGLAGSTARTACG